MSELNEQPRKFICTAVISTISRMHKLRTMVEGPNFVFMGNPGTEKTSVLKVVAGKNSLFRFLSVYQLNEIHKCE